MFLIRGCEQYQDITWTGFKLAARPSPTSQCVGARALTSQPRLQLLLLFPYSPHFASALLSNIFKTVNHPKLSVWSRRDAVCSARAFHWLLLVVCQTARQRICGYTSILEFNCFDLCG